jgi:radical SAM protein with 4Fe4S-binding SPASM domain
MRKNERWSYIKRAPRHLNNILINGRHDFTYDLMPANVSQMPLKKRLNLLKSGMNLVYRRLRPWSWPLHMHIELTNYCNLNCVVCPSGIGSLERQPMAIAPALFERLLNEVGPYLLTASLWGWGEPLLHPQLSDILRIAQNRGITTFLSTNGQNLNDEKVLEALLNYPPTFLIVALDGITDETNAKFRVGAKLEPVLTGVQRLAQMRASKDQQFPIIHWRYIVMRHNEHELPLLHKFATENQFDMLTIRTLSIIDAPDSTHRNLVPLDEKFRAYNYEDEERVIRTDFICEKAFTFPAIFADGTVAACDQDCNAQHSIGKLTGGQSFAEIWWSKQAAEIRKTVRDNPENISVCNNCPFRDRPVSTCSIQYLDLHKQDPQLIL